MPLSAPSRRTPPHVLTLVIATATGSLAMNVFLPSLPGISRHFQADYAVVQLMVSLYLAATAGLQLVIGPMSDRFGRRPMMLSCFGLFILATLGATYAPTIEALLACRVLQGFAAAGQVLSRAIVRDTVAMDEAASKIGYITMGMALVPMVAPMIGGMLDEAYGWRATFLLTLAFGVTSFLTVFFDLGETNKSPTSSFRAQFSAYPELLGSPIFWGYTLTAAFSAGAFFAFLGGGPYVASEMLHLSPSSYGFYFGFVSAGYVVGNFSSGRLSRAFGINRMIVMGNLFAIFGVALSLGLFAAGVVHPIALFGPVVFIGVGNGMTLPNAIAGIVSVKPHLAGSASGLGGAIQISTAALVSVLAGAFLGPDTGPYPLLWVMLATTIVAMLCAAWTIRVSGSKGPS